MAAFAANAYAFWAFDTGPGGWEPHPVVPGQDWIPRPPGAPVWASRPVNPTDIWHRDPVDPTDIWHRDPVDPTDIWTRRPVSE